MIKVDTQCMSAQAQQMKNIADQLDRIASSVASVNRTLTWSTGVNLSVRNTLMVCNLKISQLDEKAEKLGKALVSSAAKYEQSEQKAKKGEYKPSIQDIIDSIHTSPSEMIDKIRDAIEDLDESSLEAILKELLKKHPLTPGDEHQIVQTIADLYMIAKEKGVAGVEWFWEKISGYDLDTEIYETVVEDIFFKALGLDDIDDVAKAVDKFGNVVDDIKNGNFDGETISDIYAVFMEGSKLVGDSPFTPVEGKIIGNTLGIVEEYSILLDKYEDAAAQAILDGDFIGVAANMGKSVLTLGKGVVDVSVQTIGDVFMLEEAGAALSMITGYDIPGAFSDFGSKISEGFDNLFNL